MLSEIELIIKGGRKELNYFKDLLFSKDVVLAGAGGIGIETLTKLKKIGINPIFFIDTTESKINTLLDGLEINDYNEFLASGDRNKVVVVTIFNPFASINEIKERFIRNGFTNTISFIDLSILFEDVFLPFLHFPDLLILRENATFISKVYNWLEDDLSREIFIETLNFKVTLDTDLLIKGDFKHYFPKDLFRDELFENSIFIDCGAYNGDSIEKFIERSKNFQRIYAFEPDRGNFTKLLSYSINLEEKLQKKIYINNSAVGDEHTFKKFSGGNNMGSSISEEGEEIVQVICVDDYIDFDRKNENIFVKLDVEGFELETIKGMRRLIKEKNVFIAVSLYHKVDDFWTIPLFLKEINSNLKFFLRQHANDSMDLVLYCKL